MKKSVFKIWFFYQALGMASGWFFHGVFSHLFTGEHGDQLTVSQLVMHIISLTGTILIIVWLQNIATQKLFGISLMSKLKYYLVFPNLMFWIGYYAIGVPADILLHFLTLGLLNGIFLTRYLALRRWTIFSTISGLVGFAVGALVLYPIEPYLNSFTGFTAHIILFTTLGIIAGIPMAIFNGIVLSRLINKPQPVLIVALTPDQVQTTDPQHE